MTGSQQHRDVYAVPAQFKPLLFHGRVPMYPVHAPSLWCGSADFFTVSQQLGFRGGILLVRYERLAYSGTVVERRCGFGVYRYCSS